MYNNYYSIYRLPIALADVEGETQSTVTPGREIRVTRSDTRVTTLPDNIDSLLPDFDSEKLLKLLRECVDCKTERRDPFPEELYIYLHAFEYKGESWKYVTPIPEWAKENWTDPDYFQVAEQNKQLGVYMFFVCVTAYVLCYAISPVCSGHIRCSSCKDTWCIL